LTGGPFLGLEFSFELADFVPLKFDIGVETANLSGALIIGTFPRNRSVRGVDGESGQKE
jgi:hypothetical protein